MKFEKIITNIYKHTYLHVSIHVMFWVAMFGLQWYINSISFNPYQDFPSRIVFLHQLTAILSLILFYYPLVYFIIPKLFGKKRIATGIMLLLVFVVFYAYLENLREQMILKPCSNCMEAIKEKNEAYYNYLHSPVLNRLMGKLATFGTFIGLLFSLAIPLGIKMSIAAFREQLRSVRLAKENVQLEFDFLRSQINPHFLFNSLNNIYGLILNDDKERSSSTVARLSQFLRYTLYESNGNAVAVEKEIALMKDYTELESIRLNQTIVDFKASNDGTISMMPPLLMVPLIENAFKYGVDKSGETILISIEVKDNKISFRIENPVDLSRLSNNKGGIGISNFKKRLELYYPSRYSYKIDTLNSKYVVNINIDADERN